MKKKGIERKSRKKDQKKNTLTTINFETSNVNIESGIVTSNININSFAVDQFAMIWLAKPGSHPLGGPLNEYRLKSHLVRFPNDEITLISNYEDFKQEQQDYIIKFCKYNKIKLVSLNTVEQQTKGEKNLKDQQEQLYLIKIARIEILLGHFASASDIIRTLSVVVKDPITNKKKMYKDFDYIKLKSVISTLIAENGFLLEGNFVYDNISENVIFDKLNNGVFYCDESKTDFLSYYRQLMLHRYTDTEEVAGIIDEAFKAVKDNLIQDDSEKIISSVVIAYKFYKDKDIPDLPLALKFEVVLKNYLHDKGKDYEKDYEVLKKQLVLLTSGPECLHDAFNAYHQQEFIPYCKKNKIFDQKYIAEFKAFQLNYPFRNEDDVSWVKHLDSRKETWNKLNEDATKVQSVIRRYLALKEVSSLQLAEDLKDEYKKLKPQRSLLEEGDIKKGGKHKPRNILF